MPSGASGRSRRFRCAVSAPSRRLRESRCSSLLPSPPTCADKRSSWTAASHSDPEGCTMDFEFSDKVKELRSKLIGFMDEHVYPTERDRQHWQHDPATMWEPWPKIEKIKANARGAGLWKLFLPHEYGEWSPGLTNLEYAPLAEEMGRVVGASEYFNCSAP